MNSTPLKLGRGLFSAAAFMGEKTLAVFIVLCIFANILVPRFSIREDEYSTLRKIMRSQSVIFEFFSFSNLPVKIVNELFSRRNGVQPLPHKKAPQNDAKNTSNTSSDFSITTSNVKDISGRYSSQRGQALDGSLAAVFLKNQSVLSGWHESGAPPGVYFAFITVLMFFFLRARSALPDASAIFMYFGILDPAYNLSRVFYLHITIPKRSFL